MQRLRFQELADFVALGLVVVLAACSDANGPANPSLSRAQADSLALVVTADIAALPEGATFDNAGGVPFAAPSSPLALPSGCTPTRSPNPPANSDGDPIPDSVRVDFGGCSFTTPRGETVTLSGTIDLIDPTPVATDHAVRSVFTDLTRSVLSGSGATWSVEENGTRQFSGTASVLSHSMTGFQTVFTHPDGSTATHLKNWSATFTADVPGSISSSQPLPSGTWDVTGTSTWTRGVRNWALSVTTGPDLHYDASCTVAPKFDAGTLTAVVTRGDQTSTVTIELTACGQYTVTRS